MSVDEQLVNRRKGGATSNLRRRHLDLCVAVTQKREDMGCCPE
jgi:hypothetical protein